jgi:hypothetical protein
MLGTADRPGPATSMLNASREQMAQWNAINKTGLSAAEQASLGSWNPNVPGSTAAYTNNLNAATGQYVPTANPNAIANRAANDSPVVQSAAQGGLMGLRGYASGGALDPVQETVTDLLGRQISDTDLNNLKYYTAMGYGSTTQLLQQFNAPEIAAWKAASPETKATAYQKIVDAGGTLSGSQNTILSNYNTYKPQIAAGTVKLDASGAPAPVIKQGATKAETDAANAAFSKASGVQPTTGKAPYSLTDTLKKTAYFDPTTGKSTLPDFLAIQKKAKELGSPSQYALGTDAYKQALAATNALKNYKPSTVAAKKADVTNANAASYLTKDMKAPSDIAAKKADVTKVDTTGYQAATINAPSDIAAKKADVATMKGAAPISADKLSQYQMQGPGDINAPTATAAQMAGPKSWLDKGTAAAYMDPYMQNVVDIQKRESNRDYQQELNKLNAQSVQAGAFGGSRQAIQQAEAARNQATRLGDIQAKGQQEAYASGMGQFNTATGQTIDVGKANLATDEQTRLANQAAELQSMITNQGMDYNTAKENLAAKLGVQVSQLEGDLKAAEANQGVQQQTQATNMAATNQAQNAYVQQALQAAQANQSTQLTAAEQDQIAKNAAAQYNATNQLTANTTNANAANTASNAYIQNALDAAKVNYGGHLTTEQTNKTAADAMAAYNASNQQQTNITNAGAANTANQQYTTQNLAAQTANQGAGLQANQQNLGAASQLGTLGQGLGALGTAQSVTELSQLGAQGQVAQAEQNLGQSYLDAQSSNATSWLNAPTAINAGASNLLNAQPVSGGTTSTVGTTAPAHWARGGLIKNGKVSKRSKK